MTISATRDMPTGHVEPAYRLPGGTARPGVRVRIRGGGYRPDAPGEGADLAFVALVSTVPCDLLPLALREACGGELLEVAFADAYPLACESAVTRIGLWARRLLDEALARAFPRDEGGSLDHRPAEAEAT